MEGTGENQKKKNNHVIKVETFPVSFSSTGINNNNNLITNSSSNVSKAEIIKQAINFHLKGDIQKAIKYYEKLINLRCSDHRVFSNYGIILKDIGKLKEAERMLRKSIELNPQYANAYSNLGLTLNGLENSQEAELLIRKAIELKPDFADAHLNLGNILKDLGKLQEAELSTRKAIELNPNLAEAHYNLGSILKDLGELQEAKLSIQKAIEIKPDFAIAYYTLSLLYSNENAYIKAYKQIMLATKYDFNNHIFQGELTRIKYIIGEYDEEKSAFNIPWTDKDDYFFEDNDSDILLVSFGSMGREGQLIPSFNFYNLLKNDKSFDKLFVRDIERNYYLTGLKNTTKNLDETIDLIDKLTSLKRYRQKVAIGASSGGFAAILFANILNFSKAIAFNPQTVISEEKESIINDTVYTVELCKYLRSLNTSNALYRKCLNLKNFIPFKAETEVHFSNLSEIDKNYANLIKHVNCKLIKHNSASHLLALQLRDSKELKAIIADSLEI